MKIKIDHVNLSVTDLAASIQWYKKIFGFELAESGTSPRGLHWAIVANDDSMICMTELKDRKLAESGITEMAHRIYHFGIRVSDRAAWEQTVQQHQLKLNYGGEVLYPSSSSWYIQDPSGHEIEVSYANHGQLQFVKVGAR